VKSEDPRIQGFKDSKCKDARTRGFEVQGFEERTAVLFESSHLESSNPLSVGGRIGVR
jgi:hypothetical protein